jgi:hypothetical protein
MTAITIQRDIQRSLLDHRYLDQPKQEIRPRGKLQPYRASRKGIHSGQLSRNRTYQARAVANRAVYSASHSAVTPGTANLLWEEREHAEKYNRDVYTRIMKLLGKYAEGIPVVKEFEVQFATIPAFEKLAIAETV